MAREKRQRTHKLYQRVDKANEEKRAWELRSRTTSIVQIDDSELPQSIKDVLLGRTDPET